MKVIDNNGNEFDIDELKPCPFCGHEAELKLQGNNHTKSRSAIVFCTVCRVERKDSAIRNSQEWVANVAVKQWNKRQ